MGDFSQKLIILKEVAKAVNILHKNAIMHCDLKPENVLIKDGKVKLIDFGNSKV